MTTVLNESFKDKLNIIGQYNLKPQEYYVFLLDLGFGRELTDYFCNILEGNFNTDILNYSLLYKKVSEIFITSNSNTRKVIKNFSVFNHLFGLGSDVLVTNYIIETLRDFFIGYLIENEVLFVNSSVLHIVRGVPTITNGNITKIFPLFKTN